MLRSVRPPLVAIALGATLATLGCQSSSDSPARELTNIRIIPAAITVTIGESKPLTVQAIYSDASAETLAPADVTFSTSDGSVSTVDEGGVVLGVAKGIARINAAYRGLDASVSVQVTPRFVGLRVVPAIADVSVGLTRAMRALALYDDHTTEDVTDAAVWATHSPGIAEANGSVVAGVAAGQTRISAIYAGRDASATVTVTQRSLTSIAISGGAASLAQNTSTRFSATAVFDDLSTLDVTELADWTTSDGEVATVSAGAVSAKGAGTATVKATFAVGDGTPAEATKDVTVKADGVVIHSIAVTLTPAAIPLDTESTLQAIATLSDDSTQDVTDDVAWSVTNPDQADTASHAAILGTVATTTRTPTSATFTAGTTNVEATVFVNGAKVTGSAPLTVTDGTESIAVSASSTSISVGEVVDFSAIASFTDPAAFTFDVTSRITWWVTDGSPENDVVLVVDDQGEGIAIGTGTAVVGAWYRSTKVGEITVSVHP